MTSFATDIGVEIIRIMNEIRSMQMLYKYLKENDIFGSYEEHSDILKPYYYYRIPLDVWDKQTGFIPESRISLTDGLLFCDKYVHLSLYAKPPLQIKQDVRKILNDTHSVKRLIEFFEESSLFEKYRMDANKLYEYQIPIDVWEDVTDIVREHVDLLPFINDGSIYMDAYFDDDYRDYSEHRGKYVYVSLDTFS
jgi:hypothetical protein